VGNGELRLDKHRPAAEPKEPAPMTSRSVLLNVGEERLLSPRGTIIPQAIRFDDGSMLLHYHVGFDAWFEPIGMSRSDDGGRTWRDVEPPLYRVGACGQIGPTQAIFLDEYLVQADGSGDSGGSADTGGSGGGGEYVLLYNRTDDGGRTFSGVQRARCRIPDLIAKPYEPDASSPYFPPMPDWYRRRLGDAPAFAGSAFGRVIRLRDGALATVCYGAQRGNPQKRRRQGATADQGVAEQATAGESSSAILLRSEDEGRTWDAVSVCGRLEPGRPFDGGYFYSEGFNETALAETPDGGLFVIMRHGSYHLLWTNRSWDAGRSWRGIEMLNHAGVAPHMVRLGCGALAAAWGRPGLTVAFSLDGTGRYWDAATEIMRGDEASQRYPWLVPIDDHTVTLFYDRRTWDKPRPRYINHGIYAREISARPA
jgi:hypothetical protein